MDSVPNSQCPDYEAKRFTEFVHARFTGTTPIGVIKGKIPRKELVNTFGIRVPATYEVFHDPPSVDLAELPPRFVLKPTNLFYCQGVYLLEREGPYFFELIRKTFFSPEDLLADLVRSLDKPEQLKIPIMAEELIIGENGPRQVPLDYKFYVFGETVAFIAQTDRNITPVQTCYLAPDFSPLPRELFTTPDKRPPGLPIVPENATALLETAKRISRCLDTPFCRIDLYTTGKEVVFGELTPTPGTAYHGRFMRLSAEYDLQLGDLWRKECLKRRQPIPKISTPPPVIIAEQSEKLAKSV